MAASFFVLISYKMTYEKHNHPVIDTRETQNNITLKVMHLITVPCRFAYDQEFI